MLLLPLSLGACSGPWSLGEAPEYVAAYQEILDSNRVVIRRLQGDSLRGRVEVEWLTFRPDGRCHRGYNFVFKRGEAAKSLDIGFAGSRSCVYEVGLRHVIVKWDVDYDRFWPRTSRLKLEIREGRLHDPETGLDWLPRVLE